MKNRAREFRSRFDCTLLRLLRYTIARRDRWTCEIAIDRWFFVNEHTISTLTLEKEKHNNHSTHSPHNTLTWLCFVVLFSISCFSLSKLQNYNYIYWRIFIVTEEIFSFFRWFLRIFIVIAKFFLRFLCFFGQNANKLIELRLSKVINSSVRERVCFKRLQSNHIAVIVHILGDNNKELRTVIKDKFKSIGQLWFFVRSDFVIFFFPSNLPSRPYFTRKKITYTMDIDENTGQGTPPSQPPTGDVEQFLLHQFSRMGTTDHDELVNQLQKVLGNQLNYNTARFFLDMNNWYVYYNFINIHACACCNKTPQMFLFVIFFCLFRHVRILTDFEVMCECFYFEFLLSLWIFHFVCCYSFIFVGNFFLLSNNKCVVSFKLRINHRLYLCHISVTFKYIFVQGSKQERETKKSMYLI